MGGELAPTGDQFTTQGVGTNPAIASSANATTGITAPVTLTAGQVDNNVNAGLETPPAALGSTVWFDSNRDGLLDNSETGVAGVTVELLNGTGTSILATTTTNSSGTYAFTGLNAGAYDVKFIAPTGDQITTQGVGTNPAIDSSANATTGITAPVTLTAGQVDNNVNAGLETPPAALGSTVWFDANRDGLLDNSETGVAGVTVELLNGTGTSVLATTTTNSSGTYAFTNLNAGAYEVEFIAPTGDQFTTQGVGTNPAIDSSANATTGITAPVTLTAGQVDNNVNAGLETPPAALGSTVWFDANRDGLLDNSETGVAGVTVELLNGTGTSVLATTTTNSSGTYAFTNLNAGAYEVEFVAPTGDQFTTQGVGTNPAIDSSANATTGITAPVTLTAGQVDNNVNAGLETPPAALGSTVWFDSNRDGLLDNSETGVAGVTVELLNGTGTSILATTTTNSSGTYAFTGLNAGAYEVKFIAPTGDQFTTQGVGTNPAIDSSANATTGITAPVTLTAGQVDNNVNAGLETPPAALGSTVWFDANRDGLLDNSETGVAGVTVELLNGTGTSILATTTTNSSGTYAFTGLNAGAYEVEFVAPTGDQFTTQGVGTNPAIDSSANATTGITAPVTLTAGQVDNNVNAGLETPPAALGSTVWFDSNRDGLLDNSETGVAGVTVELLNGTGTSILATTTTNSSGIYAFTNLNAGAYEVKFIAPTGDQFTTQGVGTNPAIDSSANATTGITAPVTLTAGQVDNNVNAGLETPPAALGSTVWFDANRDGLLDNSETGVAGVTVELLNGTGTSVLATTTTNSSGTYAFTNLNAGAYEVEFIAPTGDQFTTQGVGTNPAINSSANTTTGITSPVTLTAGQVDNNVNAGLETPLAALGDYVWLDLNDNGLQTAGEPGVAGVTVDLLNATGTSILATTTTNSSGLYNFTNLNAGVYEVKFVAPTGDAFTTQGVGTNPAINSSANTTTGITAQITLTAGQVDNNVDAGLVTTASISVLKQPSTMVVSSCGQVTYTFTVTNTGTSALTNIAIKDNIGTAAVPDYVTPTLVTTGFNGTLAAGASLTYSETINQISCTPGGSGSVCHTVTGSNLSSGCTAWFSSTFNPTSCASGATYKFQGVTCTISGGGVGSKPITVDCPDSEVTFSSSCKTPTTTYDSNTNCWVTTLPANTNPGSVFLTGVPLTIPSGCNLSNSSVTWSVGDASNNCGASTLSWDANCTGYNSFNQNNCNGLTNYNQIGVQSCDNDGYGAYCAGTPINQYSNSNCGNTSNCSTNNNGCGSSGSSSQNTTCISGAADTVSVTATTVGSGSGMSAATILSDFNAIVFNNASTQCDIEGASVVGGNFSGATMYTNPTGSLPTGYGALTVFGSTTGNSINMNDGGKAYVAGNKGASINFNGGGSYIASPGSSISSFSAPLIALSQSLSQLAATGTLPTTGNNEVIKATPGANGVAVIDLTAAQLAAIPSYSINMNGASTLIFNVSGTSVTMNANDESGTTGANNIIWNFTNATSVALNTQIAGTILAPTATVTNNNQIDGVLVANAWNGSGEIHDYQFTGTLPATTPTGPTTTVSATDTKEVQILCNCSNVTVGGTATTASLSSTYGTAQTMEFTYTPGNTVSLKQVQAGMATVTGTNSNTMAFMEITDNANPFASNANIYFEGAVTSGEKIYADATTNVLTNTPIAGGHFSTTAGADLYAYVFTSQQAFLAGAAPIQTMAYNTSGSQAMHIGDTIGSLSVIGYVGANGGHLAS